MFSPIVLGQMLRGSLGFSGVVVSDDLGATAAVAATQPGERAVRFLSAGGDLIISKTIPPAVTMVSAIAARVVGDASFGARVNDAVLRVLRAKASRPDHMRVGANTLLTRHISLE